MQWPILAQGEAVLIDSLAKAVAKQVEQNPGGLGTLAYILVIASALACIGFGVLLFRLLKHMGDTYKESNQAIKDVSSEHTKTVTVLTDSFKTEMAAERIDHRKTIDQTAKMIHDVRETAFLATSSKELAEKLREKKSQQVQT